MTRPGPRAQRGKVAYGRAGFRPNLRNQLHDSGLHLERVAKQQLELTNDNDNDRREQQGWPFTCDNNRKLEL